MIILSYDGMKIIDAKKLYVSKNFGGKKEEKYSIVAETGMGEISPVVVAAYPDKKVAADALAKAFQAFAEGSRAYKFN